MWKTAVVSQVLFTLFAAEIIVDQEFTPPDHLVRLDTQVGIAPFFSGAQTFTPGISGQLAGFDFWLSWGGAQPPTANLRVEVRSTTSSGIPSGNSLGTVIVPPSILNEPGLYKHISMESINASLRAGTKYAAVFTAVPFVSAGNSAYNFRGHAKDQLGGDFFYTSGQGFFSENGTVWREYAGPDFDYAFRSYMVIPEPSSIVLLGVFGVPLLWLGRRVCLLKRSSRAL